MKKVVLVLLISQISFAQDFGYLKFEASSPWMIQVDDTLITSKDILTLKSGAYKYTARPQISYSWPSIEIENVITISAGDTAIVQLSADKSTTSALIPDNKLPKTTSYQGRDYHPESNSYPKLKTGLLLTSVAANWLAFYFKRQADDNYSKYGHAASISGIRKYYERAGNFDDASTIMLSISAAALSGYIYIALSE